MQSPTMVPRFEDDSSNFTAWRLCVARIQDGDSNPIKEKAKGQTEQTRALALLEHLNVAIVNAPWLLHSHEARRISPTRRS
jgi:hypothetical protein